MVRKPWQWTSWQQRLEATWSHCACTQKVECEWEEKCCHKVLRPVPSGHFLYLLKVPQPSQMKGFQLGTKYSNAWAYGWFNFIVKPQQPVLEDLKFNDLLKFHIILAWYLFKVLTWWGNQTKKVYRLTPELSLGPWNMDLLTPSLCLTSGSVDQPFSPVAS